MHKYVCAFSFNSFRKKVYFSDGFLWRNNSLDGNEWMKCYGIITGCTVQFLVECGKALVCFTQTRICPLFHVCINYIYTCMCTSFFTGVCLCRENTWPKILPVLFRPVPLLAEKGRWRRPINHFYDLSEKVQTMNTENKVNSSENAMKWMGGEKYTHTTHFFHACMYLYRVWLGDVCFLPSTTTATNSLR